MDARAGSLWHKTAGEAIPRINPRHLGGPVWVREIERLRPLTPMYPSLTPLLLSRFISVSPSTAPTIAGHGENYLENH